MSIIYLHLYVAASRAKTLLCLFIVGTEKNPMITVDMLNKFAKQTNNIVLEYDRLIQTNYPKAKRLLEEIKKIDNFERYLYYIFSFFIFNINNI